MKTRTLLFVVMLALAFTACEKNETEEDKTLANFTLSVIVNQDQAVFTAYADNAVSYNWDFGNGQTAKGDSVETNYAANGTYWAKCTVMGYPARITDSIEVVIDAIEDGITEVEKILCGYNEETEESTAVWYWADNMPMVLSGGFKSHHYSDEDAFQDLFDRIDQSWWSEDEPSLPESLNDEYSFTYNTTFDYTCDYKDDGFACNWAYAYHRYKETVAQYGDFVRMDAPMQGSWSMEVFDHADYPDLAANAPKTIVNGVEEAKSYFLKIHGAYLLQETGVAEYQILSISEDTIFLRFDYAVPLDLDVDPTWSNPEWISIGAGEWGYAYLVKTSSATEK